MIEADVTRRQSAAIAGSAAVLAVSSPSSSMAADTARASIQRTHSGLTLFSRNLHWAAMEEAVEVAATAGYSGICWTVRPGGHIEPHNVARDLPRAVELTHRAGLGVPIIATTIEDAESPDAEAIVETAAGLGAGLYRCSSAVYDLAGDRPAQMDAMRTRIGGLERINQRYGATALFHTHAGNATVGEAIWDLWLLVRDYDPQRIGINFDTGYGMMGAGTGWTEAVRFAHRHIRSLSLKDYLWSRRLQAGKQRWAAAISQPGEGMVDFEDVLGYFRSIGFRGPAEVQFEYPIAVPGRSQPMNPMLSPGFGQWKLEMPKAQYIAMLTRDAEFYANLIRETGLTPDSGSAQVT